MLIVGLGFVATVASAQPFGVVVFISFEEVKDFQTAESSAFEVFGRVCHLGDTYGNLRGRQGVCQTGATPNSARRRAGCSTPHPPSPNSFRASDTSPEECGGGTEAGSQ